MLEQIKIGGFDKNFSYLIVNDSNEVAIVDPDNLELLRDIITRKKYCPKMILLTHSHFDHIAGANKLAEEFGLPVYIHRNGSSRIPVFNDYIKALKDKETLRFGDILIEVLHTPGHIDDSVCYLVHDNDGKDKVLTGDTMFVGTCGHAKLEHSSMEDLWESLQLLKNLPDEVEVYPGHDYGPKPFSTIGHEKKTNKYLLCKDFAEFREKRS